MSSPTPPGADELRVRGILRQRGVGPDAAPAIAPTSPTEESEPRKRDWLDDILDTTTDPPHTPEPEAEQPAEDPEPAPAKTGKPKKTAGKRRPKAKKRKSGAARSAWDTTPPSPRQSLIEAWDAVPYRIKWLAYHASAAYLGWSMGLVDWATYVTAWIADAGFTNPQSIFWYCVAAATCLLYRRTRPWPLPLAWLAAVPVTSTLTGVLLYGTPHP